MTIISAPLKNIALLPLAPDLVRSCVTQQPTPPPEPGEEPPAPIVTEGIYTPVAPGVVYANLPVVSIVDTSPDQMIGCIISTANNPQGRLNALFPSAVNGDGVIERNTNDIWVYDGTTWNNVGPTPGPTVVTAVIIPPWNEISIFDATVYSGVFVRAVPYSLTPQLTTIPPIRVVFGVIPQSAGALFKVPVADVELVAEAPAITISSPIFIAVPDTTIAITGLEPVITIGSAIFVAVPSTSIAIAGLEPVISIV